MSGSVVTWSCIDLLSNILHQAKLNVFVSPAYLNLSFGKIHVFQMISSFWVENYIVKEIMLKYRTKRAHDCPIF